MVWLHTLRSSSMPNRKLLRLLQRHKVKLFRSISNVFYSTARSQVFLTENESSVLGGEVQMEGRASVVMVL